MYMRLCLDLIFGFGMGSKCKDGILGVFPVGCKGVPWEQRLECTQWGQTTGHHRPGQECKQQIPVQPRLSLKENALAFVTTVKRGARGHWKGKAWYLNLPKAPSPPNSSLHREFTLSGWSAFALWLFLNPKPEPENSGLRLPHFLSGKEACDEHFRKHRIGQWLPPLHQQARGCLGLCHSAQEPACLVRTRTGRVRGRDVMPKQEHSPE